MIKENKFGLLCTRPLNLDKYVCIGFHTCTQMRGSRDLACSCRTLLLLSIYLVYFVPEGEGGSGVTLNCKQASTQTTPTKVGQPTHMLAQNWPVSGPGMHLQDLNLVPSLQILQDLCTASLHFWVVYHFMAFLPVRAWRYMQSTIPCLSIAFSLLLPHPIQAFSRNKFPFLSAQPRDLDHYSRFSLTPSRSHRVVTYPARS